LDISAELLYEHQSNLEKRLASARREAEVLETRLSNEGYLAKAPAELVEETRKQLAEKQATIDRLHGELQVID
jgi:valyl-tRNA synthetase